MTDKQPPRKAPARSGARRTAPKDTAPAVDKPTTDDQAPADAPAGDVDEAAAAWEGPQGRPAAEARPPRTVQEDSLVAAPLDAPRPKVPPEPPSFGAPSNATPPRPHSEHLGYEDDAGNPLVLADVFDEIGPHATVVRTRCRIWEVYQLPGSRQPGRRLVLGAEVNVPRNRADALLHVQAGTVAPGQ